MRVPKTADTDERNRFFTQLYSEPGKPDVPSGEEWEKISAPPPTPLAEVAKESRVITDLEEPTSTFSQTINDSSRLSSELKVLVGKGPEFTGKPYFLGASDSANAGFFTFWLVSPRESTYRAFSIDTSQPAGQAQMKVVLFAFEQKAQQVAVYSRPDDSSRPVYITVYP
jgi:hypothetical protein